MTPSPINLLSDSDEQDDDPTIVTTKSLSELAASPASELFVHEQDSRHARACWAKRWIRRFRLSLAFAFGAFVVVQLGGVWWIHSLLRDLDVRTAKTVENVLREHKLVSGSAEAQQFIAQGAP